MAAPKPVTKAPAPVPPLAHENELMSNVSWLVGPTVKPVIVVISALVPADPAPSDVTPAAPANQAAGARLQGNGRTNAPEALESSFIASDNVGDGLRMFNTSRPERKDTGPVTVVAATLIDAIAIDTIFSPPRVSPPPSGLKSVPPAVSVRLSDPVVPVQLPSAVLVNVPNDPCRMLSADVDETITPA